MLPVPEIEVAWIGVGGSLIGVLIGVCATLSVQLWTAKQDRKQQLRLAALDRRLEAHQEAYRLMRELEVVVTSKGESEAMKAMAECQDFWGRNCLYLGEESRKAFALVYSEGALVWEKFPLELGEVWERFAPVLQTIAAEVGLPAITEPKLPQLTDAQAI